MGVQVLKAGIEQAGLAFDADLANVVYWVTRGGHELEVYRLFLDAGPDAVAGLLAADALGTKSAVIDYALALGLPNLVYDQKGSGLYVLPGRFRAQGRAPEVAR